MAKKGPWLMMADLHCAGQGADSGPPGNGPLIVMAYEGSSVQPCELPDGLAVSTMRLRDIRQWFALMRESGLASRFLVDGVWKFVLDRRYWRNPTFLIRRGAELVASASAWSERLRGMVVPLVHMVAVAPRFRRMGLGTYATWLVVDYFRGGGFPCGPIWLRTNQPVARRLYEKMGFVVLFDSQSEQGQQVHSGPGENGGSGNQEMPPAQDL